MMYSNPLMPPRTYAEWSNLLGLLQSKADDEAALYAMQRGTLEWQYGVAERFLQNLMDVVSARMNTAVDKFQKELGRSHGEERILVQAIGSLRREFAFLAQAVNLPAIEESTRMQCYQVVRQQADKVQQSLEDSAKSDRSGKLAYIIRNNKVNSF